MAQTSFWDKLKTLFSGNKASTESFGTPEVKDGIWYASKTDGNYLLGIDTSVYDQIGQITFADFPTDQSTIEIDDDILDIEGDKSVETLKSPIAGEVIERNSDIGKDIDRLNQPDPKINWIMVIKKTKS